MRVAAMLATRYSAPPAFCPRPVLYLWADRRMLLGGSLGGPWRAGGCIGRLRTGQTCQFGWTSQAHVRTRMQEGTCVHVPADQYTYSNSNSLIPDDPRRAIHSYRSYPRGTHTQTRIRQSTYESTSCAVAALWLAAASASWATRTDINIDLAI